MIKVTVRESSVVKPAKETPKVCLWTSNFDQLFVVHAQTVYFYRRPTLTGGSSSSSDDFFDSTVLKDGLSKALVYYYPIAGRLKRNESGRAEINCTGEGATFIEAETDSCIEDLGDFTPDERLMPLLPKPDYGDGDISSCPPFLVKITRFKCGGVCVSTALSHILVDGVSGINFINTWSDLCRGVDDIKAVPLLDRTILRARDPPVVSFPHVEYKLPSMNIPSTSPLSNPKIAISKLNISTMQTNQLKSKCNNNEFKFSTYEVIAGHIWRCSCKARELKDDQETTISMPLDCRSRSSPPLPDGYFGNAIFDLTAKAIAGDIVSKPLSYAVNLIHETLISYGSNEYFRSAIDFLELNPSICTVIKGKGCNFRFTSWVRLAIYEADFGWGQPHYMGPGANGAGRSFLIPNPPRGDGGLSLIITLDTEYHMDLFTESFYDI
ncbi:hypothetical protein C5167_004392 [Papaver somniferum]|uniref:Uncharacterized protein n=1 Tax=Papaver somniferum TaxID=3469 RepID=A0A4Y7J7G9_PAPSO|nr:shikimate O-hydroxycinnamoyltransferase-like [Papaver somniferum]RZC57093.1 hypothetical protein C5167_004392 [Papaver somniferum]